MEAKNKVRAHIYVTGKVQGVYFRQNTKQVASKHGITGWVRNLDDGRVEAIFEGEEMSINKVIEWCHIGPSKAHVDNVDVKFEKYAGEFANFDIV